LDGNALEEKPMPYSLDDLIADCRAALKDGESPAALETVRVAVEKALADREFLENQILSRKAPPERVILHEDPEQGFCVCAHVYDEAKPGDPHDHGPTWAVYGQAEGETEMTDWEVVSPAEGETPAKVRESRRYVLKAGQAHAYPTGAVHAPIRYDATKLLRIEGVNTDRVTRTPMEPA
jgi:predicted metal-dependent enzyme (double-stranded beta helix superfamily)